jgi:hypothetical protein
MSDAERAEALALLEFLRFCGLGCDEQNDSHEQQQNRSPLRPGV